MANPINSNITRALCFTCMRAPLTTYIRDAAIAAGNEQMAKSYGHSADVWYDSIVELINGANIMDNLKDVYMAEA
jgi:hypothetical protein